jgi:enolase
MRITKIAARIIRDSRGEKTIEVAAASRRFAAKTSIPSGKSTGKFEAVSLPAKQAIRKIKLAAPLISKLDFKNQKDFDKFLIQLDGTKSKSNLGANSTLALSLCFARLSAKKNGLPLYKYISELSGIKPRKPHIYANLINAGLHAKTGPAFQEYLIVPVLKNTKSEIRIINRFYRELGRLLKKNKVLVGIGDEGGYVIKNKNESLPFLLFDKVRDKLNLRGKINYAIDVAANSFYKNGKYKLNGGLVSASGLIKTYLALATGFDIISIEDPFDEKDFKSFAKLRDAVNTIIVGDDLTVTNPVWIKRAHATKSINGVIIKPNQIGTLTETIEAAKLAEKYGFKIITSHRSGETKDDWICDVAVGIGAFGIKIGAPKTPYRLAKYKRLAEIKI